MPLKFTMNGWFSCYWRAISLKTWSTYFALIIEFLDRILMAQSCTSSSEDVWFLVAELFPCSVALAMVIADIVLTGADLLIMELSKLPFLILQSLTLPKAPIKIRFDWASYLHRVSQEIRLLRDQSRAHHQCGANCFSHWRMRLSSLWWSASILVIFLFPSGLGWVLVRVIIDDHVLI